MGEKHQHSEKDEKNVWPHPTTTRCPSRVSPTTTGARVRRAIPDASWARDSREAACGGLVASPT